MSYTVVLCSFSSLVAVVQLVNVAMGLTTVVPPTACQTVTLQLCVENTVKVAHSSVA